MAGARISRLPTSRPVLLALLVLAVLTAALLVVLPRARATAAPDGPLPTGDRVADGVVRQTGSYGPYGDENTYDVYLPAGQPVRARPTVLFLHGGSWEYGDKVEYTAEAVEVARRGWTAVSLNYRRTPTAPWPAPLLDVRRALLVLQARAGSLGIDVARTGALGDSVGGQLAALVGQPQPGVVPVRAVVTWSGINDTPGLLRQPSAGGCVTTPCAYTGLARKVVERLMRCTPDACPSAYRTASAAAGLRTGPATFAVSSERELIDPRQAWVMDTALARAGVTSRVRLLPGRVHGRGYQRLVWQDSLRFLAAALTPETAPAFPRPEVSVRLATPQGTGSRPGVPVRLTGAVRPRAVGSSVALQVQQADGGWRTARTVPLVAPASAGVADTVFELPWTPTRAGTTVWRALWRGSGGLGTSAPVTVVTR